MSPVFVDTSAILALLNPADEFHARARRAFEILAGSRTCAPGARSTLSR